MREAKLKFCKSGVVPVAITWSEVNIEALRKHPAIDGSELYYLAFPKLSTTRMHGLHAVRSHFSSFLETCHYSQNPDDPKSVRVKSCAVTYYPDSKGACESILASCLEVMVVR